MAKTKRTEPETKSTPSKTKRAKTSEPKAGKRADRTVDSPILDGISRLGRGQKEIMGLIAQISERNAAQRAAQGAAQSDEHCPMDTAGSTGLDDYILVQRAEFDDLDGSVRKEFFTAQLIDGVWVVTRIFKRPVSSYPKEDRDAAIQKAIALAAAIQALRNEADEAREAYKNSRMTREELKEHREQLRAAAADFLKASKGKFYALKPLYAAYVQACSDAEDGAKGAKGDKSVLSKTAFAPVADGVAKLYKRPKTPAALVKEARAFINQRSDLSRKQIADAYKQISQYERFTNAEFKAILDEMRPPVKRGKGAKAGKAEQTDVTPMDTDSDDSESESGGESGGESESDESDPEEAAAKILGM